MLNWGIIGLGNISERFIKSLSNSKTARLYAVASYTASKRELFQQKNQEVIVYSSYDALLLDPSIDVVYIAVRHNDHYEWSKKALQHGKAVLCEKPSTLHYKQTKELCELSKEMGVFYMEAMKTRFLPTILELKRLLKEGIVGKVERVETSFCDVSEYDKNSYLYDEIQGGALYDLANYNLATIFDYIDEQEYTIQPYSEFNYGVDVYDKVELAFPSGSTALIEVGIDRASNKQLQIIGEKGIVTATPFYRPQSARIELHNGEIIDIEKPYIVDDFYTQIEEVHHCIKENKIESKRMTHEDMMQCAMALENIKQCINE